MIQWTESVSFDDDRLFERPLGGKLLGNKICAEKESVYSEKNWFLDGWKSGEVV